MNRLEVQMCLIDHEINELVSKKNLIDIRLTELYEQREDVVTEWENQELLVKRPRKDSYHLNEIKVMTRKEIDELVEGVRNGDL